MATVRHRLVALLMVTSSIACGSDDAAGPQPSDATLLVHLTFDGNANDQSGNGNHGTLLGGASAAGFLLVGDNTTDMLTLPASVMDGLVSFSFAAWLRIDAIRGGSHEVLSGANAAEDNAANLYYRELENEWRIGLHGSEWAFTPDATIEDGLWHHIALVRSGSTAELYFDGVQLGGELAVSGTPLDIDAGGLVFGLDQDVVGGGFDAGEGWAGAMDNLRLFDGALTEVEIETFALEAHD